MFGLLTVIFAVCWLPYHVYFLYSYYHPEIMRVRVGRGKAEVNLLVQGLVHSQHVPRLLLAGHVHVLRQSSSLLRHEQEVDKASRSTMHGDLSVVIEH